MLSVRSESQVPQNIHVDIQVSSRHQGRLPCILRIPALAHGSQSQSWRSDDYRRQLVRNSPLRSKALTFAGSISSAEFAS
eukprot:753295-Hanusia_phi.AAC.3